MSDTQYKSEILLRDGQFVSREIAEVSLGSQEDLIEEILKKREDEFVINPVPLPALGPYADGNSYIGSYKQASGSAVFIPIAGFPFPGSQMFKRPVTMPSHPGTPEPEAEATHHENLCTWGPPITPEGHRHHQGPALHPPVRTAGGERESWKDYYERVTSEGFVLPEDPEKPWLWSQNDLKMWLMAPTADPRRALGVGVDWLYFFVIKEGMPYSLKMPNIFEDARVCSGSLPESEDRNPTLFQTAKRYIEAFFQNQPNTDLMKQEPFYKTVSFHIDTREPVQLASGTPKNFLYEVSDARIIAFAKALNRWGMV